MNTFTKPQLEVVSSLAECYYDTKMGPIEGLEHMHEWGKARYVEAIIAGLADPDYWGE